MLPSRLTAHEDGTATENPVRSLYMCQPAGRTSSSASPVGDAVGDALGVAVGPVAEGEAPAGDGDAAEAPDDRGGDSSLLRSGLSDHSAITASTITASRATRRRYGRGPSCRGSDLTGGD